MSLDFSTQKRFRIFAANISVFGSFLNRNFGRNRKSEVNRNRNRNTYRNRNFGRNRNRNRNFPITNPNHPFQKNDFLIYFSFIKSTFFCFEYHSFENRNIFERTDFERTYETCLYSHERFFSFKTNFERTTDEFRKNVIRSNDLARSRRPRIIFL